MIVQALLCNRLLGPHVIIARVVGVIHKGAMLYIFSERQSQFHMVWRILQFSQRAAEHQQMDTFHYIGTKSAVPSAPTTRLGDLHNFRLLSLKRYRLTPCTVAK